MYDVTEGGFQIRASEVFKEKNISVKDVSVARNPDGNVDYSFYIEVPKDVCEESLINMFEYRCAVDFAH